MTEDEITTRLNAAQPHLTAATDLTDALPLLAEARILMQGTGITTPKLDDVIGITVGNIGRSLASAAVILLPELKVKDKS